MNKMIRLKRIIINCEKNPNYKEEARVFQNPFLYLGYEFCVHASQVNRTIAFIKSELKAHDQPLIRIDIEEVPIPQVWDLVAIEKCIREGYK